MLYSVGDKVIHFNGGVFIISDFKVMNCGQNNIKYYCLTPYYNDTSKKNTLVVYVPEGKANELIRPLLTKDEAECLIREIKEIEPIWFNDMKERKNTFDDLVGTKKLKEIYTVFKSLYVQQEKLMGENKSLNLLDYDCLNKVKKGIVEELSISLNIPLENVEKYLIERII